MFKKTLYFIVLTSLVCSLSGCGPSEPMAFGIPKAEFTQLNPDAKQRVIEQYNQQQAQKTKDDALWGDVAELAGSVAHVGTGIEHSHSHSTEHSSSTPNSYSYTKNTHSSGGGVHFGF